MRKNGYRGEPSRSAGYTALLPGQRLCLKKIEETGKRCVEPRNHKGKCRS